MIEYKLYSKTCLHMRNRASLHDPTRPGIIIYTDNFQVLIYDEEAIILYVVAMKYD